MCRVSSIMWGPSSASYTAVTSCPRTECRSRGAQPFWIPLRVGSSAVPCLHYSSFQQWRLGAASVYREHRPDGVAIGRSTSLTTSHYRQRNFVCVYSMEACRRVEMYIHSFLNLGLFVRLVSLLSLFSPREKSHRYLLKRRWSRTHSRSGIMENRSDCGRSQKPNYNCEDFQSLS